MTTKPIQGLGDAFPNIADVLNTIMQMRGNSKLYRDLLDLTAQLTITTSAVTSRVNQNTLAYDLADTVFESTRYLVQIMSLQFPQFAELIPEDIRIVCNAALKDFGWDLKTGKFSPEKGA